jgi:hypothetical protein
MNVYVASYWGFSSSRLCLHEALISIRVRTFPRGADNVLRPSSQLPQVSTMASTSQGNDGRDGLSSTLDSDIQVINRARDTSGIPPAQDAFDSAGALLTTIRVRSLPLRGCELQAHIHSGPDVQQTGIRRSWAIVRRGMQSSRPGVERQADGRSRSVGARGNWRVDHVS